MVMIVTQALFGDSSLSEVLVKIEALMAYFHPKHISFYEVVCFIHLYPY